MSPFKGVMTALVTPLKNNTIDEPSLRKLVNWQIESGIRGLVPCGTTGESATLSLEERKKVIEIVIDETRKRVPVIAGTGTHNTSESVTLTQWAKEAGADGVLAVTPYYNKPSQDGLYLHYLELSKVGIPLILYNVPSRTSVSLALETIQRLAEIKNIVAIKEATGSLDFASQILQSCGGKITLLSGDDFTFLPLLSVGAEGIISVVSNITPQLFSDLYESFLQEDLLKARSLHFKLYPLIQTLFLETNPIPVKTALALMEKIQLEFRLPLCSMKKENEEKLRKTLHTLELI